jgi:hypothetical protein
VVDADLISWAQRVRADFEQLSANLVDLDADPTTKLLQAGGMSGASAAPAAAASEALHRLWAMLPAVRAQLTLVDEELAKGRKADDERMRHLLHAAVVELDGAIVPASARGATAAARSTTLMTIADAMNVLVADYRTAADVVARIGAAWRDGLPLIDQARMQVTALTADIGPFPEAAATSDAVQAATTAAATDPLLLADQLPPLQRALDAAVAAHATLVARRDGLGRSLDEAAAQLARIDQTIRDGTVALDDTREKIAGPAGLLAPLDAIAVLDTAPRGLAPWLEKLRATAPTDWRAAVNGLVAWKGVADGVERSAGQVLAANRAPLDRRNDLRGLLGGLAAKAGAAGRAEDPELSRLHREARELLYVAPCDLAAAAAAVEAFARAVNRQEEK